MSIGGIYLSQALKVNSPKRLKSATGIEETKSVGKSSTDGFSVSDFGKDLNTARKALKETPDVRQNLVDDIKVQFEAGQYSVSTSAIADKLLG